MVDSISLEPPVPNLPLLRKVLDHIDAHPEEWNQGTWGENFATYSDPEAAKRYEEARLGRPLCGTTHCIAGHAVAMTEGIRWVGANVRPMVDDGWYAAGARVLGLTADEASDLFESDNRREDIQRIAEQIAARAGEVL